MAVFGRQNAEEFAMALVKARGEAKAKDVLALQRLVDGNSSDWVGQAVRCSSPKKRAGV